MNRKETYTGIISYPIYRSFQKKINGTLKIHITNKITDRHFASGRFNEKKSRYKPIELINPSKMLK